ncbi:hypothetical protein [Sphingorhabdus sp. Alg231-15]|uniref:hypothetical protein n=1 Tax=Sphingorhabdus sp. Alg231-15 TaxID=1922222 RepID=UPI000D54C5E7
MKKLMKPALILTPAIFALAACDAPPAEDPAADGMEIEDGAMEEPVDTGPLDDVAPADGGLEGGAAPADEIIPEIEETVPPAGEDSMTEEPAATEDETATTE